MLKKTLLTALFFLFFVFVRANQGDIGYQVSGQAIDSLTLETLPYVTCAILRQDDPQDIVTRFAGGADGNFSGSLRAPGKYVLVVSFVGKKPYMRSFEVTETSKHARLGTISLGPDGQTINEVNVVAVRPIIRSEADRIIYDAQQDPETQTSSVLEMLRKVPLITVDGQDNVQLKGASNFVFHLNGKPTQLFSGNPGMILRSIPASMVKSVEVITEPGARYDAEGIGGIINIVTVQQSTARGYSATLSAQGSSRGSLGGGLNLVVQQGKFSFSGNFNYSHNKQFPVITTTERGNYLPGAPYPYGKQVARVINESPMQFSSAQLSYEHDSLNLVTVTFNRRYGRPEGLTTALTENFDADMNPLFVYNQTNTNKVTWGGTDLGVDYQRSFKRNKSELFTLSYRLGNTPNSSNFEATNVLDTDYLLLPQPGLAQWSRSENVAFTNEHTFQADYTLPILKGHTIETGVKYILRLNSSETNESHRYFNFIAGYPFIPYIELDSISSFSNNQDILGTYLSYTGNLKQWGLKTGLRYEYTWLEAQFNETDRNFNANYGALVPSAILTYRITDMKNVKLGYNNRIQRPGIGFLNPYVDRRDPNYINYGNPDLDPERSHAITLGYSSFTAKFNLNAELAYNFVNNAIEQYSFIREGGTIQEITFDNIGKNRRVGVNLFGNYRGLSWLNLFVNSNVNYVSLQSNAMNLSNSGITGRLFGGGTVTLPKDYRISAGAGGNLPQVNLQGSQSAFYFSYMAISKALLNKRLNVSLSGVWLPKPHIILNTEGVNRTTGELTFRQLTDVHLTKSTELRLNISYRIGNVNAQVRTTRKTIDNDDQKMRETKSLGDAPM